MSFTINADVSDRSRGNVNVSKQSDFPTVFECGAKTLIEADDHQITGIAQKENLSVRTMEIIGKLLDYPGVTGLLDFDEVGMLGHVNSKLVPPLLRSMLWAPGAAARYARCITKSSHFLILFSPPLRIGVSTEGSIH
jgi:hypothetical protein